MYIFYHHLGTQQKTWEKIVVACINSLPAIEKKVIPDIKIYPTRLASIVDNFDIYEDDTDIATTRLLDNYDSWIYSQLKETEQFKNKFISISTITPKYGFDEVPPEVRIFHEFGHCQIEDGLPQEYTKETMIEIKKKCDRYALFAHVRLLHINPNYNTPIFPQKFGEFENDVRQQLAKLIPPKKRTKDLTKCYLKISQNLYKQLNWETLYDDLL